MIDDKHSDFAKHINDLHCPLDRPYSGAIDKELLQQAEAIEHLNKEIADVNPDYLTFLPTYFWYWYFGIGWVYVSSIFLTNFIYDDITYVYVRPQGWGFINIIGTILYLFGAGLPLILLIYQLIRKHPIRTQYYFLKKEQKVVYYYRASLQFFKPFELKIVDYKDLIPDVHTMRQNSAYTPLNLYIADPDTGVITHHIKPHDMYVDPRVHWAFIRTYMESPAEDLPIDPKFCEAYPADTSQSLFACSDITFRKHGILNRQHSGGGTLVMLIFAGIYALGYLLQGNNYQAVKQAINHPKVKALLTWDGQNNPYAIQPITEEAREAFAGKNWQVNIRWIIAILLNLGLFVWAVVSYNS